MLEAQSETNNAISDVVLTCRASLPTAMARSTAPCIYHLRLLHRLSIIVIMIIIIITLLAPLLLLLLAILLFNYYYYY